jgi:hypothetical protein
MNMSHLILDRGPWFLPTRLGYGTGLPIASQGWVLLLSYLAGMAGLALLAERSDGGALAGVVALMAVITAIFVAVAKARTRGEWRWRWGDDD